jgi:hypothetical protein
VELLRNHRHPLTEDLRRLSLELAGWMLFLGGKVGTPEEGIQLAEELLTGGLPLKKFGCMIAAQAATWAGSRARNGCTSRLISTLSNPRPRAFGQRRLRPGGVDCAALGRGQNCAWGSCVCARRRRDAQEGG